MRSIWLVLVLVLVACKTKLEPPEDKPVAVRPLPPDPMRLLDQMRDAGLGAKRATSPLPEAGPHPDYPTPVASGTDKIFTLEDPDRGAKVPTTYALPARGSLAWTTHAFCEVGALDVACGAGGGFTKWRVGRRGKELIVAESMRGTQVVETYVYVAKPDGKPIRRVEIDMFGRVVEMLTFTAAGRYSARRPTGENGLAGCGSMAIVLDKHRRETQRSCLQWTGQPMRDTRGVATTRFEYDARGIVTAQHFLGLDGKPTASTSGVTTVRFDLDKAGRDAVSRNRGPDDKPILASDGCYGWRYEHDARGLDVRRTCLDANDKPQQAADRTAIESYRRDARGCVVASRFSAADGQPSIDRDNVHGIDFEVDARCQEIRRTCVNIVEQPVACGLALPAGQVSAYDKLGKVVSRKHYNADRSPGADPGYHVFELRWQYDDAGHEVGESCYDSDGTATECSNSGFHAQKQTHDDAGRLVEKRFYDANGAPATNLGVALRRYRYDSYDHIFETTGFDASGDLDDTMGMTIRRELYDLAHRHFAIILLDKAGHPASYTGCFTGSTCPEQPWHAVRIVRGTDGTVTRNQFFDAAGQLVATHDCRKVTCMD